jgi:hypothetical protein
MAIDLQLTDRVANEKETRRQLLKNAKIMGCEKDMLLLFAKYDKLLRNCTDAKERKDIGKMGVLEMYCLLGKGGQLYVDGQLVYDDKYSNE